MKTLIKLPILLGAISILAACSDGTGLGIAPKYGIERPVKVEKLPDGEVKIGARTFKTRRERATYADGKSEEIWEMSATGQWIKCFSPTQAGCEKAYNIYLRGAQGGGYG
ncbi:hypothetical protein [Vannielia litorea]|uniref:hypothetical protein n=1 Tax=Vannielia litorea TaxID=1217970 RepID=UPI001C952E16|nr:hypothetical protein [Vannielia litorea]MBY6046462.1 hypothetical protein [Vannielia litorea]MBY6073875.1 hypothetical protein [Vannielia litorea]